MEEAEDHAGHGPTLRLAYLDDDNQGKQVAIAWDLELDVRILRVEGWTNIGDRGFDSYQLEPLHKALRLPWENLFIADHVGLGKTIEAGFIASELLLRRHVRDIVVACPPSMLLQWKDEMESRFGLRNHRPRRVDSNKISTHCGRVKASLMRRLFSAVAESPSADTVQVCHTIVADERRKGHAKLAAELQAVLEERRTTEPRTLRPLPDRNGRSAIPLVQEIPHEHLRHEMVLPKGVEVRFQRIEKEFAARSRLTKYGFRPRQRILLHGPPGCGKSLGAERLAWNTGLALHRVRFESLLSSYFGETAANLHRVFENAQGAPCALFLDECDTIATSRRRGNDVGEVPRIVNTLLQLLEEYSGEGLVIAATNLTASLDRALFRRFDEVIVVPLPASADIERLLKLSLSAMRSESGIDWANLSRALDGHSCSDVVRVAENAAKRCILQGRKIVLADDLHHAMQELNVIPIEEDGQG